MNRARPLVISLAVAGATLAFRTQPPVQRNIDSVEWTSYGADLWSTKYSPLAQITGRNFSRLKPVWRWTSPDGQPSITTSIGELTGRSTDIFRLLLKRDFQKWRPEDPPVIANFKATPLMAGGMLFLNTPLSAGAAIDAVTGRTIWIFNPKSYEDGATTMNYARWNQRGVAYWADGEDRRVLWGTGNGYLIAVEADTGLPVAGFGDNGRVDLMEGLPRTPRGARDWNNALLYSVQSPPLVVGDLVIPPMSISSYTNKKEGPPGWIRAFDVRTGRLKWTFRTIPVPGEPGNETWEQESWAWAGKVGPWPPMSADAELGYIYAPVATALPDHYGGHRPGDNLYADSLVCLDAATGRRVWHFQMVHHGLWDYDPPAAPNLLDVIVNGKTIKAVAQVTKQGFVFVFDRVTGAPIWPIVERYVAPSDVPGEVSAPTQPVPTKPAPFEYQGVTEDDLADFTPAIRQQARQAVQGFVLGALYTPPSLDGTVQRPGIDGGANWSGAAVDPETGYLYVPSRNSYSVVGLEPPAADDRDATLRYVHRVGARVPRMPPGIPLLKPPYSRVTAIDLNSGDHIWMVPLGSGNRLRNHPQLKHLRLGPLGGDPRTGPLLTKTMLVLAQAGGGVNDGPRLVAYDKRTGRELGWAALPAPALGTPMTYLAGGRQYIALTIMGNPPELIAFALPNGWRH